MNQQRLQDRVAIVTGAGQGIGKATATLFAQHGAKVLIATRTAIHGEQTVREIRDQGGVAELVTVELGTVDGVHSIIDAAIRHWGRIDIIVHNAARIEQSLLTECDDEAFTRQFDAGMNTGFWLIRHGHPHLKQSGSGRILFTSSVGARVTATGYAIYGAVKAGIEGLVRGAAHELGAHGITVNAVSPGGTKTPSLERSLDDATQNLWASHIPMRRMGLPEDIASAMLYLASEEASYVTGHVLTVDGGQGLPQAF